MDAIARALLEYETLDAANVKELMEHGRMINPPRSKPPAPPMQPAVPEASSNNGREADAGDLPPGLAGAPA